MAAAENPHGDGTAAQRIVDFLERNQPLTLE
jgi:UDP-N-acetylglucosamine 2-epimerase